MIDIDKEISIAKAVYQLMDWSIAGEYVDDLKHPLTGESCDGLCLPNPENKSAYLQVRNGMPDDVTLEVTWHEMAHCLVGMLRGERVLEEHVVYPIGRAMGWIRFNAPELLKDFATSLPWSRPASLASLVREASRGNYAMLAASVRAQAKGMAMGKRAKMLAAIEKSAATDEEKKAMIAELDDLAPDSEKEEEEEKKEEKAGDVEKTDEEKAAAKKAADAEEEKKAAAKKAIGVDEKGERNDDAVAARVRNERNLIESELDSRPDLTPAQKAFARAFDKPEQVKAYVATIAKPASAPEKKTAQTDHRAPLRGRPAGGLVGSAAKAMSRAMGITTKESKGPYVDDSRGGIFIMPAMGPGELRSAMAKGYDPRKEFPLTEGDGNE